MSVIVFVQLPCDQYIQGRVLFAFKHTTDPLRCVTSPTHIWISIMLTLLSSSVSDCISVISQANYVHRH